MWEVCCGWTSKRNQLQCRVTRCADRNAAAGPQNVISYNDAALLMKCRHAAAGPQNVISYNGQSSTTEQGPCCGWTSKRNQLQFGSRSARLRVSCGWTSKRNQLQYRGLL